MFDRLSALPKAEREECWDALLQLAETWTLEKEGREALQTIMAKNEDIGFDLGINEVVIVGHMFSDGYVENMRQKLENGGHLDVHMGGMISSRGPNTRHDPMTIPINLQEILERLEDSDNELVSDDLYQRRRFDLCADCYRRFIKDPIGHDARAQFGFSQN